MESKGQRKRRGIAPAIQNFVENFKKKGMAKTNPMLRKQYRNKLRLRKRG